MWREISLGALADITSGGTPSRDIKEFWGGDIPWVTPTDITACRSNYLYDSASRITEKGLLGSSAKILPPGSILFTSRATIGAAKISALPVCTNQGFKNIAPSKLIDGKFLFYQIQRIRGHFERFAAGSTFPEINKADTARVAIHHPVSLAAQKKIASIISSVDAAIEKTEALIEKYQQIKAGLMHDLFTRGVLPDGKLRPTREQAPELYRETGIGWVPKGWGISKLETMAKIVSGVTLGAKESPSDTIEAPYLRVANVQDGYLDLAEIKTVRISRTTLNDLRLQPGDVLMNEGGDFDKLGRGAVWAGEIENCVHQNHVFRVRVDEEFILPNYLALYSESSFGKKYFLISSKQSTNLASINSTQLKNYPISLPDVAEQQRICATLARANQRIAALKTEAEKMRSQKNGLMHDLLTGKVAVKVDAPIEQEA